MSYPDYPKNRLIVDGTDLTTKYGLILADGYALDPPEPKTYTVDIPGGDGVIDLTDSLLGDTAYKNRKMELEFYIIGLTDAQEFEAKMTDVKRYLHGNHLISELLWIRITRIMVDLQFPTLNTLCMQTVLLGISKLL